MRRDRGCDEQDVPDEKRAHGRGDEAGEPHDEWVPDGADDLEHDEQHSQDDRLVHGREGLLVLFVRGVLVELTRLQVRDQAERAVDDP